MDIEKKNWFAQNIGQLHRIAKYSRVDESEAMKQYSKLVGQYLIFFPDSIFNEDYVEYIRSV